MRHRSTIIALLAVFSVASAETKDAAKEPDLPGQRPREVALDNLLSERESDQALEKVIAAAKEAGIKDQAIIEARFLYHIDRREDAAIAAMLPEFLKQQELFRIEDSAIFSVKEDWLAVTEYVQAIAALKKGDKAAFKTHITEAFWLSPRQASAFAPHIDRLRLEESMSAVKIDFESRFLALGGGDAVSLSSLMKDKKAMILHFWSPVSRECEASMPDFVITAKALGENGIAVVSIIPDSTPAILRRPCDDPSARRRMRPAHGSSIARKTRSSANSACRPAGRSSSFLTKAACSSTAIHQMTRCGTRWRNSTHASRVRSPPVCQSDLP